MPTGISNGVQMGKANGVRCGNSKGVRIPCCNGGSPPPPPPPPPGTCGSCEFTTIPYSFRLTLSDTVVSTDCCADQSVFLNARSLISTVDGVYCLIQAVDPDACVWKSDPPDITFRKTDPGDPSSNACDDPPTGSSDGLHFDFRMQPDGLSYILQIYNGDMLVFWAQFSFPAPCESITVENSLTVEDICVNSAHGSSIIGGGGSALIEIADCAPDLCDNDGLDDCANTIHVSVVGGTFDGLEADIVRTDPSTHVWGDDSFPCPGTDPCAFIECNTDTGLTLSIFTNDHSGSVALSADGSGPCPTGRTWTIQTVDGIDPPTSVSVT